MRQQTFWEHEEPKLLTWDYAEMRDRTLEEMTEILGKWFSEKIDDMLMATLLEEKL